MIILQETYTTLDEEGLYLVFRQKKKTKKGRENTAKESYSMSGDLVVDHEGTISLNISFTVNEVNKIVY